MVEFDAATQTIAQQHGTHIYEVRIVKWYDDNEMSCVNQLIRTMICIANSIF